MRITARQLRQIIREELSHSMHEGEDDETEAAAVAPTGADPYAARKALDAYMQAKGGYDTGDKKYLKLQAAANIELWNETWESLNESEKRLYVALISDGPDLLEVAGAAVRKKSYRDYKLRDILYGLTCPVGSGGMFGPKIAGSDMIKPVASKVAEFNKDNYAYDFNQVFVRVSDYGRMERFSGKTSPYGEAAWKCPNLLTILKLRGRVDLPYSSDPARVVKEIDPSGPLANFLFEAGFAEGRRLSIEETP